MVLPEQQNFVTSFWFRQGQNFKFTTSIASSSTKATFSSFSFLLETSMTWPVDVSNLLK